MQLLDNNINAFLELVRAGLWEKEARLLPFGEVDYKEIIRLAEEQSVVGLVTAGIEHVVDVTVPKEYVLQFVGRTMQIEQRNNAMNSFIVDLIKLFRKNDIYAILVKGQGIAQCYKRPIWRIAGDIDLLLYGPHYDKAKALLVAKDFPFEEDTRRLHLAMTIYSWVVELHGTMHTDVSRKMNKVLDKIQNEIFSDGCVKTWKISDVDVFLPNPNDDAIIIFTHIINHFYGEGIGLRQICDLSRLLWLYKEDIDKLKLIGRIKETELVDEWKAFTTFMIDYLGMPIGAVPFNEYENKYHRKAKKIRDLIIETGSFGLNKDESYRTKNPKVFANVITFFRRAGEYSRIATIFPRNAVKFFLYYTIRRVKANI